MPPFIWVPQDIPDLIRWHSIRLHVGWEQHLADPALRPQFGGDLRRGGAAGLVAIQQPHDTGELICLGDQAAVMIVNRNCDALVFSDEGVNGLAQPDLCF